MYNDSSGSTDLLGDVEGFYESGTALNAGSFVPVDAAPVLDTASGTGVPQGAAAPGSTTDLTISGVGGVPTSNVSAVVMTVTASSSTSPGTITVYPDGSSRPATSNLDYSSGQAIANTVIVPVDSTGQVDFYNDSTGSAQLAAYIVGYYRSGPSGSNSGSYHPLAPTQILDTSSGTGAPQGAVAADGSLGLQVDGVAGVPSSCVSAVALNLTASSGTSSGSLVAYPAGSAEPDTANLDYASGQPIAGLAIVAVSAGGKVDIANRSSGTVQIAADVVGYTECDAGADHDDLWSYADLHGNTTATADDAGDRVGQVINYDPWGTPMANPVSAGNAAVTANFTSFGADAKITDPDSGITIMGARAYNPAEARFTSVDPMQGGCANGYVYVFGDPLSQRDLSGTESACHWQDFLGLWAGAAATIAGGAELAGVGVAEGGLAGGATVGLGVIATGTDANACFRGADKSACVGFGLGVLSTVLGVGGLRSGAGTIAKGMFDSHAFASASGGLFADVFSSADGVADCGSQVESWIWHKLF
ncbi:RHS repeat-associated core domain-containing protein [Nocardioides terrisoli]|uniref:RHS repeat-associated core domain-containing protein n=1 Tax=Nocardioides terrisoli TaxID=3388267 RepID=UPI00287BA44F|nr:RHS repeat-associated core domain-containing protein [Nocardioides marmorisolisilvae]